MSDGGAGREEVKIFPGITDDLVVVRRAGSSGGCGDVSQSVSEQTKIPRNVLTLKHHTEQNRTTLAIS